MKIIEVVCAIIETKNEVLAAQRSPSMDLPFLWEFPGGKIEVGESKEEGLKKEIREELNVEIDIISQLTDSIHVSNEKTIKLSPFICRIASGVMEPLEHMNLHWCSKDQLNELKWCPADLPILREYLSLKSLHN